MQKHSHIVLSAVVLAVLTGPSARAEDPQALIANAISAAPPAVGKNAAVAPPVGPADPLPPAYWDALLRDAGADARQPSPSIRTQRLSQISRHLLRVTCGRCSRTIEIQKADAAGYRMVDAPVSGGIAAADAGTLTFMVGGTDEASERARPILEKMGKAVIHAGGPGSGQAAKICNNMLLGASMIATCETFVLAKKLGLDLQTFFDISSKASGGRSARCW